jgi:hypothetical protein
MAKPVLHGADHSNGVDPIPGLGGGIQFDTAPQVGGFLEITTTTGTTTIENTEGNTIYIDSSGGPGGFVAITTGDGTVFIGSFEIVNRMASFGTFRVQNNGGTSDRLRITEEGFVIFGLGSGKKFEVLDSAGTALLRVTDAGTYHIKSGASWVADL